MTLTWRPCNWNFGSATLKIAKVKPSMWHHSVGIKAHLPLVPLICVSKLGHHCSDNGLSPVRRQAITWTNAGLLSIGLLGTSFSEIWIGNLSLSCKKMYVKMSSAKMAAILSPNRPVGSEPLSEPIPTSHQRCSVTFICEQFHKFMNKLIRNICSEITLFKLLPYLLGINGLRATLDWRKSQTGFCFIILIWTRNFHCLMRDTNWWQPS